MVGVSSSGPSGETGNWKGYSLTTHGTPNTESNTAFDQPIYHILIINDGASDILFGFGVTTATKSFTVKAGETLACDIVHKTLYYKSAGATVPFRVLVIW